MHGSADTRAPRLLPGGLVEHGTLARGYAFRRVDGTLELALADAAALAASTPQAVTLVLAGALVSLAGAAPQTQRVEALCVADRQVLMRELERHLGVLQRWFSATCSGCRARFDMQFDPSALPVKPAGASFPHALASWGGDEYRLRVPCGVDQAWLVSRGDTSGDAARALAARLVLAIDGVPVESFDAQHLPDGWLDAVDAALDEAAPIAATQVQANCPECGHGNTVALDPYGALARTDTELLDDVHSLASHYHWSEREILALPRERRHDYLRRIDAAHGLAH